MVAVPVWGAFLVALVLTLYFASEVLVPLLFAVMFSIVLRGPVNLLRRLGLPTPLGAALVVLGLVVLVVLAAWQLSTPAAEWVSRGPLILHQAQAKLGSLRASLQAAQEASEQISKVTEVAASSNPDAPQPVVVQGPSLLNQLFSGAQRLIIGLLTTLVLIFFLLGWGRPLLEGIIRAMPDAEQAERSANLMRGIGREVAAYLGTVAVINAIVGVVTAVVMGILGVPSPALWGVLAGVLNFIPYIGPLIMMGTLAMISLLTFDTWTQIVEPPLAFVLIHLLEGELITPSILGRRLTLNPALVFLFIIVWEAIWGIPGAFLAVPLLAALKATCDHVEQLRNLRPVLGASPMAISTVDATEAPPPTLVRRLLSVIGL